MKNSKAILLASIIMMLYCIHSCLCDGNHFKVGEKIPLYTAQIGPHYNPQETYNYYNFPFCQPKVIERKSPSIGEALQGIELAKSVYNIQFRNNVRHSPLCEPKTLSADDVKLLSYAVKYQYWYKFYLDDLHMWAMVGGKGAENQDKYYIYTHSTIKIGYNGDQIVDVTLTVNEPEPLVEGFKIPFTYSVEWVDSDITHEHRFRVYLDHTFFEHKIHWFSILNSFAIVIFIALVVILILISTLKKDIATLQKHVTLLDDDGPEDSMVWKTLHSLVFLPPSWLTLYSAILGTGYQIIVLVFFVIFSTTIRNYYDSRGALVTTGIVFHAFTSMLNGYISGSYYAQHHGRNWIRTMLLASMTFPGVCLMVGCVLNTLAIFYTSSQAVPFLTVFVIFVIFVCVTLPLVFIGTILGRNIAGDGKFPCESHPPSLGYMLPPKRWYQRPLLLIIGGGILPFASIFIETYFIFTSLWSYKYYYVYGFFFLIYVIVIIVSGCVAVVVTFILLNSGDHRWVWISFLSSASTGVYIFIYSIYFYMYKTKMSGFFQTTYYFGYSYLISWGIGIICGTMGFIFANIFVRKLYATGSNKW